MGRTLTSASDDLGRTDGFHDLLPALARGLDVRDIFRQLSDVAVRIVPHDEAALLLTAILAEGGLIHTQHLALQRRSTASSQQTPTTNLGTFERETIERVLRETQWNKSKAAKRLGLSRTQLYVRMRKYGLEAPPPVQN